MHFTLACLALILLARALPQDACSGQSNFNVQPESEFRVMCPVGLPMSARQELASIPYIRNTMREQGVGDLPSDWFTAAYVHLGPFGERDLLAMGNGPLLGANVDPIWVLRPTKQGRWTVIVNGAPVLSVKISEHRTNGYCDLIISKATAVQAYAGVLRFDGRVYRLAKGAWTPIR
jgi:hypothetical protein